jgi:hypothetical protein
MGLSLWLRIPVGIIVAIILLVALFKYREVYDEYIREPLQPTKNPWTARRLHQLKRSLQIKLFIIASWLLSTALLSDVVMIAINAWLPAASTMDWWLKAEMAAIPSGAILFLVFLPMYVYYAWQPVRLFCPHCGMYTPSTTPWVCGPCERKNLSTGKYSFLGVCNNCRSAPDAFWCHRCDGTFFFRTLNEEERAKFPDFMAAYAVSAPPRTSPTRDQLAAERRAKEEEVMKHEITMTDLEAMLAEKKKLLDILHGRNQPVEKSAKERAQATYERDRDNHLAVDEVAADAMKRAEDKYANDPVLLAKEKAVIEAFIEQHGLL